METARQCELTPEEAYFQAALQLAQQKLILKEIPAEEGCNAENAELDRRIMRLIDRRAGKRFGPENRKITARRILGAAAAILLLLHMGTVAAFALSRRLTSMPA